MSSTDELVQQHVADTNNPHNVTKEQLGLGGVENNPLATPQEAEAGNVENRYVTPFSLKSVFDGILKREGLMDEYGNVIRPQ